MKRLLLSLVLSAAIFLAPTSVRAGARQAPGPYEPPPAASYPSTPPIDASKPVIELAPAKHRPIDQTPEENPVDPLGDSKTPAGPTPEAEEVAEKVAAGDTEAVGEEDIERDVKEVGPSESSVTRRERTKGEVVPFEIIGGGCSLVR